METSNKQHSTSNIQGGCCLAIRLLPIVAILFLGTSCHKDAKRQPQQIARDFFIHPPTNGTRSALTIILTNKQPPVMIHAAITISDKMQFQFVTVMDDGQQRPVLSGSVPEDVFEAVISEVRGQNAAAKATDAPAYIAATDAKHPPNIQSFLDSLPR